MKQTANYKLNKPENEDFYNVEDFNQNFDLIDDGLVAQKNSLIEHTAEANPHNTSKNDIGLGNVDNTADMAKPVSNLQKSAIDGCYQQSTGYTDEKITDLVGGAPSNLDTLKEIADAIGKNEDVVKALDETVGKKANQTEFNSHQNNSTVHITAAERTTWNGKANASHGNHISGTTSTAGRILKSTATSGTTAWETITSKDIQGALGYIPPNELYLTRCTSYSNTSNTSASTKTITINFPYMGSISPCYPRNLIRINALHNATATSGVGTYVLYSASISGTPQFTKIGGEDLSILYQGIQFDTENLRCTLTLQIVIRQNGFLQIEHSGSSTVDIT